MSIFWSRKQEKQGYINTVLLVKVRGELEARYSRPERGEEFISKTTALEILTRDRVGDLLRKLSWYREDDRDILYQRMRVILCILITINFEKWDDFRSIFFANDSNQLKPLFADKDLPLHNASMLPTYLQDDFLRQQYTFLPIVIVKDTHMEYDQKLRLPIIKTERISGSGAQGDVDKVWIEKGFLESDRWSTNKEPRVMARKRITRETKIGQKSFNTERYNLEQFKKSLVNHTNIMQSFASFIYGPDFVILSDWAEGWDLHHFLYYPHLVFRDYMSRSSRFSPDNLFAQAYALAQALDFLHHRMVNGQGGKYQCAHLDLKPANILVCMSGSGDTPVGRWKITDFGLSNVELSVAGNTLVPTASETESAGRLAPGRLLGEQSLRPLRRGRGPFQPPEVRSSDTAKVSTRRDVWSFGCILAMVLAFALGGPEEVEYQTQCRGSRGADDFFYKRHTSTTVSTPGGVDAEIKPEIQSWLLDRAPSIAVQHSEWVQHCSSLVIKLLEVDVVKRPEMNQAVHDLLRLLDYTNRLAQYRIWEFDASTLAPEPVPTVPDMQVIPDTDSIDSPGPYVGVRTNSDASSLQDLRLSPSRSPSRSTRSVVTGIKADPSLRFISMESMKPCQSAAICPAGMYAALRNESEVLVYDLSNVGDDHELWQENVPRTPNLSERSRPLLAFRWTPSTGCAILDVAINGPYLAILVSQRPSHYILLIGTRLQESAYQRLAFDLIPLKSFDSEPYGLKLSTKGSCLVQFSNKVSFVTMQGSADIDSKHFDVMGVDFSGDGSTFCLWGCDGKYHHWRVWDHLGKELVAPMTSEYKRSTSRVPAPHAFLIPFHNYPRYIACDKYGRLFLVRVDAIGEKVQPLGRTENVFSTHMLPDDTAFLLIRASGYSNQKLQRINLTFMNGRTFPTSHEWGVLPENIDKAVSGICVRRGKGNDHSTQVLTLSPSGLLIRKTL